MNSGVLYALASIPLHRSLHGPRVVRSDPCSWRQLASAPRPATLHSRLTALCSRAVVRSRAPAQNQRRSRIAREESRPADWLRSPIASLLLDPPAAPAVPSPGRIAHRSRAAAHAASHTAAHTHAAAHATCERGQPHVVDNGSSAWRSSAVAPISPTMRGTALR